MEKRKVVAKFERIFIDAGLKLNVKKLLMVIGVGNLELLQTLLDACVDGAHHRSMSYRDVVSAICQCLSNHTPLLQTDAFEDPTLSEKPLLLRKKIEENLHRAHLILLSQYVRLCKVAIDASKLTGVTQLSVAKHVAPTLQTIEVEFPEKPSQEALKALVNVIRKKTVSRGKLVCSMINNFDEIFGDASSDVLSQDLSTTRSESSSASMPTPPAEPVTTFESTPALDIPMDVPSFASSRLSPSSPVVKADRIDSTTRIVPSSADHRTSSVDYQTNAPVSTRVHAEKKSEMTVEKMTSLQLFPSVKMNAFHMTSSLMEKDSMMSVLDDLTSASDSCLSEGEDLVPDADLPIKREGYLMKHPVGYSIFASNEKRYFRLRVDARKHVAFLSYYKSDDEGLEAKRHCIVNAHSIVKLNQSKGLPELCITFFDSHVNASRKGHGQAHDQLHLNIFAVPPSISEEETLGKVHAVKKADEELHSWYKELRSLVDNFAIAAKKRNDSSDDFAGGDKSTVGDADDVIVAAGYAPTARTDVHDENMTHQHGVGFAKTLVSKKKRRLVTEDGFDLDLAYITSNIIAMGFPSSSFEGWFVRNNWRDVRDYLNSRHGENYRLYNLCIEKGRTYDSKHFGNRVECFPHFDHNPPPMNYFWPFCRNVAFHLTKNKDAVAAIHCKAGKGRTGVMISAYLLYRFGFSAATAMEFYGKMRTHNGKGVTLPSQKRFIGYFDELCEPSFGWSNAMVAQLGECPSVRPVGSSPLRTDFSTRHLRSVTLRNVPSWMIEHPESLHLKIISGFWDTNPQAVVFKRADNFVVRADKSSVEVDLTSGGKYRGLRLLEEVKFVLCRKGWRKKKKVFFFWIHGAFCGTSVILTKTEIDGLHKDKKHKKTPKSFFVELELTPMLPHKSETNAKDNATGDGTKDLPTKSTKSYDSKMFHDENDYSFRQGLTEAEKMYTKGDCTEAELRTTLKMLDVARYCRMLKIEKTKAGEAGAEATKTGGRSDGD